MARSFRRSLVHEQLSALVSKGLFDFTIPDMLASSERKSGRWRGISSQTGSAIVVGHAVRACGGPMSRDLWHLLFVNYIGNYDCHNLIIGLAPNRNLTRFTAEEPRHECAAALGLTESRTNATRIRI